MKLAISESFQPVFYRLKQDLPGGILLHGMSGTGVHTIARELAGKFPIVLEPLTAKGDVDLAAGTISVEAIRRLYSQTKGQGTDIVVILAGDRMSEAAQNALLKLLEEPNSTTRFILSSYFPDKLLATIRSRVQASLVPPLSDSESRRHLLQYKQLDDRVRQQILFVANGRPELIDQLASDSKQLHELTSIMQAARTLLSGSSLYERSIAAYTYGSSKQQAIDLCDGALSILLHTLNSAPSKDTLTTASALSDTRDRIGQNANPRLQLLHFVHSP